MTDSTLPLLNEIKDLQRFFEQALAQLENEEMLSMTGIDSRIALVCKKAQSSPPNDQRLYLPELNALINLLNEYEKNLRSFQSTLETGTPQGSDDGSTG